MRIPEMLLSLMLVGCASTVSQDSRHTADTEKEQVEVIATSQEDADTCSHGECAHITESALRMMAKEHYELLQLRQFVKKLVDALNAKEM